MTAKTFSVVLGEINEKYLNEAISYKAKKKNGWLKWGAIAACLCLVVIGAFVAPNLIGEQSVEQPMGQGFFNATVVEIEGEIVVVECTDSLQSMFLLVVRCRLARTPFRAKPFQSWRLAIMFGCYISVRLRTETC